MAEKLNLGRAVPKKGIDYWTEADKKEINAESQSYIAKEIAKKTQLKPEFANSVAELEESGDTSKLYVLPDGYIYAWMEETATAKRINQFNSKTAKYNVRISGSSGNENTATGVLTTPLIDFEPQNPYIVRISGVTLADYPAYGFYVQVSFYNNGVYLGKNYYTTTSTTSTDFHPFESVVGDVYTADIYRSDITADQVRVSMCLNNSSTSISSDDTTNLFLEFEPKNIPTTSGYKWASTGHAFVPADYEDRITTLETDSKDHDKRIAALENKQSANGEESPPDYWIAAIANLSATIKAKQASGVDAFQFVWFSDMHGVSGYANANGAGTSSQTNIGKVAQYLCDTFDIPLVATSGDIMSQASHTSVSSVYTEYKNCREILKYIDTDKFLAVIGNHDGAWGAPQDGVYYLKDIGDRALYNEVYRKQATDLKRIFGTGGSYFYVDSYPQKVRIFMLNSNTDGDSSNDSNGNAVYNSQKYSVYGTEQLEWLANSLNSVPKGFTVIAMAHQPLNTSKDGSLVAGILTAYNNRGTYSGTAALEDTYWGNGVTSDYNISQADCNFTNAKGEFVAFFHGHIHYDKIDAEQYSFPCISITTAGADVRDSNPVERVVGTATETALDVVTIDKLNRKIYMTRVGAGSDREVSY